MRKMKGSAPKRTAAPECAGQAAAGLEDAPLSEAAEDLARAVKGLLGRDGAPLALSKALGPDALVRLLAATPPQTLLEVSRRVFGRLVELRGPRPEFRQALPPEHYAVFLRRDDHHYVPSIFGKNAQKLVGPFQDELFNRLAGDAVRRGATLLHLDRLFTIYHLVRGLARAGLLTHASPLCEVGVYKGGTVRFLAELLRALDLAQVPVFGFDTFAGHSSLDVNTEAEPAHRTGLFSDTSFEAVSALVEDFPAVRLHKGRFQDTRGALDGLRPAFVHLDVDLASVTGDALEFLEPRIAPGGCVLLDDYGFRTTPGIQPCGEDFAARHPHWRLLPLLTGQGVLIKTGERA